MASEPTTHVEPFDQGLVTARDQALLQPGELAQCDNCVYMPNDPSIRKAKGRTVYNSTAITGSPTVKGLRLLNFDQTDNPILVAHVGSDYQYSTMSGETGTWSLLQASVGSGNTLEAVQYNNRHYLLNGAAGQNYVVRSDNTVRVHGLAAVNQPCTPALVTPGAWSLALGVGYYFFLTVEVINPTSADEIESTNIVDIDTIKAKSVVQFTSSNISSFGVQVTIHSPIANSTATHWRVYGAGPYASGQPDLALSDFKLLAQQDIGNSTVQINATQIAGTNERPPSANAPVTGGGWTNPGGAHTKGDGSEAISATHLQTTLWTGFGFSISGTVAGLAVEIGLRESGNLGDFAIIAALTKDNGANYSTGQVYKFSPVGTSTASKQLNALQPRVVVLGSNSTFWGLTWAAADVNTANFGVKIQYYQPNPFSSNPTARIDYIKITVYTTGTSASTQISYGKHFPVVVTSVAGVTSTIGSHGLPSAATTGDIFEGQLVTNDVADASRIVYSLPDEVDYFPSIYFVNFETKQTDEITLVKRLGDKLIIGQKTQLFRVNYLPRETDAEFDRGRCYETISEGQGVVGVQAAATFTAPGGPLLMAFVSYSGIHITDGFQVDSLTEDLDWPGTVDLPTAADPTDVLKNCILVDYPQNYWLKLYYPPVGGSANTRALTIHYHPSHRKANGKMKITGPETVAAGSATCGRVADSPVLLTGSTDGKVYVEDRGYTQNQGGTLAVTIKTREMYPWGMDNTGSIEWMGIRHNQDATSTVTLTQLLREGDAAQTTHSTIDPETFTTAQAGLSNHNLHFFCDSWQLKLTEPGADGGSGMRLAAVLATVVNRGGGE